MEHGDYPLRLQDHLERHGMPEQTIANIGRMCRVSMMSEQSALALLEEVDAGRKLVDAAMSGAIRPDTAWDGDMLAARRAQAERSRVDL